MLCINCSKELIILKYKDICECSCGISYSNQLIEDTEKDFKCEFEWETIRIKKLFRLVDGSIFICKIGDEIVHPDVYDLHNKFLSVKEIE